MGYNFLYWSSVIRPGDQVNRQVDLRTVPTLPFYNARRGQLGPGSFVQDNGLLGSGPDVRPDVQLLTPPLCPSSLEG